MTRTVRTTSWKRSTTMRQAMRQARAGFTQVLGRQLPTRGADDLTFPPILVRVAQWPAQLLDLRRGTLFSPWSMHRLQQSSWGSCLDVLVGRNPGPVTRHPVPRPNRDPLLALASHMGARADITILCWRHRREFTRHALCSSTGLNSRTMIHGPYCSQRSHTQLQLTVNLKWYITSVQTGYARANY